jgi:hypothetical protein
MGPSPAVLGRLAAGAVRAFGSAVIRAVERPWSAAEPRRTLLSSMGGLRLVSEFSGVLWVHVRCSAEGEGRARLNNSSAQAERLGYVGERRVIGTVGFYIDAVSAEGPQFGIPAAVPRKERHCAGPLPMQLTLRAFQPSRRTERAPGTSSVHWPRVTIPASTGEVTHASAMLDLAAVRPV